MVPRFEGEDYLNHPKSDGKADERAVEAAILRLAPCCCSISDHNEENQRNEEDMAAEDKIPAIPVDAARSVKALGEGLRSCALYPLSVDALSGGSRY